jgi:prevent-host-death family protein
MSTKTVDVDEVQQHLPDLLSLARQGNDIIIVEGNTPIARLVPIDMPSKPRVAGLNQGAMRMRDDFNEPLPDSFWMGAA